MELANRVFAASDLNIKGDYAAKIEKIHNSKVKKVDFQQPVRLCLLLNPKKYVYRIFLFVFQKAAVDEINNFVKQSTKDIIPKLFEDGDLDTLTKLVLINAIYFKGDWKYPFDPSDTKEMEFHVDSTQSFNYSHGMNLLGNLRSVDFIKTSLMLPILTFYVRRSFSPEICLGFGVWGTPGPGIGLAWSYLC